MQNNNYLKMDGRKVKASRLLFENLIEINRRNGLITLDSKRMLLISSEAMGILRRDLVSTMGMERAKGFLMRYGWAYGSNDGEALGKMFDWESLKEYLLSGPVLATTEGIVTVEPEVLEIFDDGKFYSQGYWKHSYEAEEHIRHFGQSNEAVCYSLVGYASGFLTKAFGRTVLVKEVSCKAKGDDCCYFIAKTVEDDIYEYQDELRYYQAESLASELDTSYKEMQQLNQMLIYSENIHSQLTSLMLNGKNLHQLIDFLSGVINRSIVIEKVNGIGIEEAIWKTDTDIHKYKMWKGMGFYKNDRDRHLFAYDSFELKANGKALGIMVIIGSEELTKQKRIIMEKAVSVITTHLFHQESISKYKGKIKADVFEEILRGNYDEYEVKRRVSNLGIDLNSTIRIVCIKLKSTDLIDNVMNYINTKFSSLDVFLSKDRIILILSKKIEDSLKDMDEISTDKDTFESQLIKIIQDEFGQINVYIGSGRSANTIAEMGESYEDAFLITDFIQLSFPQEYAVATFEQLEPIMLFVKSNDHDGYINFCKKVLSKLIEHDKAYQGNLVVSLKTYLDNSGNLLNTARDLHLSIAGLRYRIKRIEELCEINLSEGTNRFTYHLAVQIYFTLRLINENPFGLKKD